MYIMCSTSLYMAAQMSRSHRFISVFRSVLFSFRILVPYSRSVFVPNMVRHLQERCPGAVLRRDSMCAISDHTVS